MSRSPCRLYLLILLLLFLAAGVVLFTRSTVREPVTGDASAASSADQPERVEAPLPSAAVQSGTPARETHIESIAPGLIAAISSGTPITFRQRKVDSKPIYFRPNTVTSEDFRATIGTGADTLDIDSQQVFTGRSLLGSEHASLAIVNGQLAAHVRHSDGDIRHYRSNPETGEIESITEHAGDTNCVIDPASEIATTISRDPLPDDPWIDAVPATIEVDPEIAASSGTNPANGNL